MASGAFVQHIFTNFYGEICANEAIWAPLGTIKDKSLLLPALFFNILMQKHWKWYIR